MTPLSLLPLNSIVSFEMYPTSTIGTGFQFAKVVSYLDANTVRALGIDTLALHQSVYSQLPPDVPNNPSEYSWVKFILQNGQPLYLGAPWIRADSIVVTDAKRLQFEVDIQSEDQIQIILQALAAVGMNAVNVKTLAATG